MVRTVSFLFIVIVLKARNAFVGLIGLILGASLTVFSTVLENGTNLVFFTLEFLSDNIPSSPND